MTPAAAMLLAAALLSDAGPSTVRARAGTPARTPRSSRKPLRGNDPLAVASSLDVLAVCLAAGMAVSTAAAATAASAPPLLARVLRRAADLLALGADPAVVWNAPPDLPAGSLDPQTDALLRLARRSSVSGVALSHSAGHAARMRIHAQRHRSLHRLLGVILRRAEHVEPAATANVDRHGGEVEPAVRFRARRRIFHASSGQTTRRAAGTRGGSSHLSPPRAPRMS